MNYLVYPCKTMKLTQSHTDGNHAAHSSGSPADFPFDEACENTGRSVFYCPCDELKLVKKYTAGVNTLWLESTAPVVMPCGSGYITLMVEHPDDDDMKKLSVGQTFKRGTQMFREGKDGATGNHFHISVGTGHILEGGWTKNSKGAWVLRTTGKPLKVNEAFYLQNTTVLNDKGYHFTQKPKEEIKLDNIPDKYAASAVAWALQKKILVGDTKGDCKLHRPITRQDALVMLYRALH